MLKKLPSALLSLFFTVCLLMGIALNANAASTQTSDQTSSTPTQATSSESALISAKPGQKADKTTSSSKKTASQSKVKGGVVAKGMYSSGSSSKPYSPFATNLSSSPSHTPSLAQDSTPTSFGSGWTSEILTFASNNLLNTSDPANADSPSVTSQAVISFLEGKGITVATAAQAQITNEVNSMLNTYDNRLGLVDGAPLARIFSIQIICMKNTSTGQLVYPEAFPQNMLDKDYSSQYQSSWNEATKGKSYLLDATYIWNTISYNTSNVIWEDPALTPNPSKTNSGIYSLDQIEQNQLKSMTAETGKINSLNLIGITQRAYAINTNPPSLSISNGYEESTGNNGSSGQTAGGMTINDIIKPGSSTQVNFSVETGPSPTPSGGLVTTLTLSGAPNVYINPNSFGGGTNPAVDWIQGYNLQRTFSNNNRTVTITFVGSNSLPAYTTVSFYFKVEVTNASSMNKAEVCAVTQGTSKSNDGLTLSGQSAVWCFAIGSLSQKPASPATLYPSKPSSPTYSYVSMEVPGWAFQYNGDVVNTLWSTLDDKATSLGDYEDFQQKSPKLDQYSVDTSGITVTDLTTGAKVTSLFSSSYSSAPPYNTGLPYSGAQGYGGWSLTPPSLTVSWNNEWTGASVDNPSLWGYSTTPIGYDMFEVTFPVTLSSTVGGDIYTQSSTSSPATTFSSGVYSISTPLTTPPLSPISLTAAGIKGSSGTVESTTATATLGVPMNFEAEADFPTSTQISSMQAASDSLVFYDYDVDSNGSLKGASVNGIALSSLPAASSWSKDGGIAILLTPQDLTYIADHASSPSKLLIDYDWYITSAPSHATSEIGYVKGSTLSLSAPNYEPQFVSASPSMTLTLDSNGTGPLTPNAAQSSALTGIWFQNDYLQGAEAKGSEFTVQNSQGQYLTPSSGANPPYAFSSTPYDFKSTNGDGLFRMWGLADGTYTVTEAKLPDGAFGTKPSFKVTLSYASGKPSMISDADPSSLVDASTFTVFNQQEATDAQLPLTGGRLRAVFLCVTLPVLLFLAGFAFFKIYKLRA